ncbi:hypothetical protein BH11MYX4_BH11MYX4_64710 [soil metagenome]
MTPEAAALALSELAGAAGIEVRVERFEHPLAGKGGLCRIEGVLVILVDAKLGVLEQAGVIGLALAELDLEGIEVPRALEAYLRTGHGEVKPLTRPRPLVRVK